MVSITPPATSDYVCVRCSQVNPTCCRINPGAEKYCFPLSNHEIQTISAYSASHDFYIEEPNQADFIHRLGKLLPWPRKKLLSIFSLDNSHFRLNNTEDYSCVFLGNNGCSLPHDLRPVYCRIYPFWFYNDKLFVLEDPGCLAQNEQKSVQQLIRLFGVDPEDLRKKYLTMVSNLESSKSNYNL
ncbi:YkgJ family cysteine cluster protein [Desulfonatronovibrio magnus]|uniref:YkgJ family cysteine cluster protein n=1 Tax=Desulfonatronovibrio magnus TaxID=698827 RepID=UPI000698C380|nr:YkgJ family cysteine cluster protein [Desulfonatronovibrio magnus]